MSSLLNVTGEKATGRELAEAEASTSPEVAAARVLDAVGAADDCYMPAVLAQLRNEAEAVHRGDLSQPEAMLMNQATALQTLFARLTERALSTADPKALEPLMRLALKAQSQCRTTLQVLGELKHPPAIFARQANFGHNQQVNNHAAPSPAREIGNENEQNKLSEGTHELLPDTRAPTAAVGRHPAMDAMDAIYRPEVSER